MRKFWTPVALGAVIAAIVSAQTLVEHATAAAGGTAAAAAGKKVSDGIDSVFGALGNVAKDAAGKEDKSKSKARRTIDPAPPIPEVRLGAISSGPAAPTAPLRKPAAPVAAKRATAAQATPAVPVETPAEVTESSAVPVVAAPPAPPQPTAADLASLSIGASRQDVTGKLGRPSSRVTMDDEGKLVEVYSFRGNGASIGSVRLVDGVVKEVRPAQ
ncbi:MAG: hypothetical protein HY820_16905 [Acidobacteria bacterium]|nr:hypothetical protein [Acidobacteriota bacterium]